MSTAQIFKAGSFLPTAAFKKSFICNRCKHIQSAEPAIASVTESGVRLVWGSRADFCDQCDSPVAEYRANMAPVFKHIASTLAALKTCEASGNTKWTGIWSGVLAELTKELPRGSGFDCGAMIDADNRVVITTSFHHMDEHGGYDGRTDHSVIVTPSLVHGFDLDVTGENRGDIHENIADTFSHLLSESIDLTPIVLRNIKKA